MRDNETTNSRIGSREYRLRLRIMKFQRTDVPSMFICLVRFHSKFGKFVDFWSNVFTNSNKKQAP